MRSRRFASRAERDLEREVLVSPYPELGLVAAGSPGDPEPELVVEEGVVVSLDGRAAADFDIIDRFVVAHGLDLEVAAEAMQIADADLARMLVDVGVSRAELVRLARGLTPAKLARVVGLLEPVELMLALRKLRSRRAPANQAHVTNLKESPALLAADAAEAARRGFAEIETTVGVARYAPLNAIALLVGSQAGRPGVMTQCAVEEKRNLELAIRGLVTYAETLSVYGTEGVFVDGDDTPWSKAFLGAAYASRGVKVRFTSGTGSEALMGQAGRAFDALPRGALPRSRARRGLAGRPERLDLLRRARALGARRDARDPRGERARGLARPRGRVGERRDRFAFRDPQDGQAHGAVPARDRLRHLRLLGHAATRQHVRRRQLRRRRPRRVADDPARLADRRRHRARRRGGGRCVSAGSPPAPCRRCSRSSASLRSPTRRSPPRRAATTPATCPTATGRRTSRRRTRSSHAASPASTSRSRSTAAASRTWRRPCSRCSVSASRRTTSRPRR